MAASPQFHVLPTTPEAQALYVDIEQPGGPRGDSGIDLRFPALTSIPPAGDTDGLPTIVDLGIRVRCTIETYNPTANMFFESFRPYQIVPRSSISKTPLSLANSVGIVDRGYTGTLKVAIRNHGKRPYFIQPGTALFQLVCPDMAPATVTVVQDANHRHFAEADPTQRGSGGFGSTGAEGQK